MAIDHQQQPVTTPPESHADYINPDDFPTCWRGRPMTVDVETKEKELAVVRLMNDLQSLHYLT